MRLRRLLRLPLDLVGIAIAAALAKFVLVPALDPDHVAGDVEALMAYFDDLERARENHTLAEGARGFLR